MTEQPRVQHPDDPSDDDETCPPHLNEPEAPPDDEEEDTDE